MDRLWMLTSFGDFLSDRDSYFEVFFCILCFFRLFTTLVQNLLFLCAGSTRLLCVCERDLMRGFECGLFSRSYVQEALVIPSDRNMAPIKGRQTTGHNHQTPYISKQSTEQVIHHHSNLVCRICRWGDLLRSVPSPKWVAKIKLICTAGCCG